MHPYDAKIKNMTLNHWNAVLVFIPTKGNLNIPSTLTSFRISHSIKAKKYGSDSLFLIDKHILKCICVGHYLNITIFSEKWKYWYLVKSESVSHSVTPNLLWPHARLLCPWNSPSKNTGMGSHYLLQETFQGIEPGLLHWRQILYHLSHQGSPYW